MKYKQEKAEKEKQKNQMLNCYMDGWIYQGLCEVLPEAGVVIVATDVMERKSLERNETWENFQKDVVSKQRDWQRTGDKRNKINLVPARPCNFVNRCSTGGRGISYE